MYLTAEIKKDIFKKHGSSEKDTGSPECQVVLFTERINHLTGHLKAHKKDYSTKLSLTKLVGKRRKLLDYLFETDIEKYRALIKELKLRR